MNVSNFARAIPGTNGGKEKLQVLECGFVGGVADIPHQRDRLTCEDMTLGVNCFVQMEHERGETVQ